MRATVLDKRKRRLRRFTKKTPHVSKVLNTSRNLTNVSSLKITIKVLPAFIKLLTCSQDSMKWFICVVSFNHHNNLNAPFVRGGGAGVRGRETQR